MAIDTAKNRFDGLYSNGKPGKKKIETEQDTRFLVIDRMLTEVMGWQHSDVRTEPHRRPAMLTICYRKIEIAAIIWALRQKSKEKILVDNQNPKLAHNRLGGPALKSAGEGKRQARQYSLDHGVPFAVLPTGFEGIFFIALRTDRIPPLEGTAIVFPTLDGISENFATFHDSLSKSGFSQ